MRRFLVLGIAFLLLAGAALAAPEKFEDRELKLALEAPAGFVAIPDRPKSDDLLGDVRAVYVAPDVKESGGLLIIHRLTLPAGVDYAAFRGGLAKQLGTVLGDAFKLNKQDDVEAAKLSGFFIDFQCPGDGAKPNPAGTISHHVRWFLLREPGPENKLIGFLYGGREANWKELEPLALASFKSLKTLE